MFFLRLLDYSITNDACARPHVLSITLPRLEKNARHLLMAEITTIDCQYVYPEFAAAFLLTDGDHSIFIENNTAHSVPHLLKALKDHHQNPETVDWVIITHVHLDHAGGSSTLMRQCKNAKLIAHPKAARHIIDPSKLVASAKAVYGDEVFQKLYGEIEPISADRVVSMEDEAELTWQNQKLKFLHTRGHANHHFCILVTDQKNGQCSIFTGDSFGLAYPALQKNGLFIFPSTSPTDFDPTEARNSIFKIRDSGATKAYLTHFGIVSDLNAAADQLIQHIDFSENLLNQAKEYASQSNCSPAELSKFCMDRLTSHFKKTFEKHGLASHRKGWELIQMDLKLNADGIAFAATRGSSAKK